MRAVGVITRCVLVGLSVFMIGWYFVSRMVNIGSIFGVILFFAVGLCALFATPIGRFLKEHRKKKWFRILSDVAAALMGVFLLWCLTLLGWMVYEANRQPAKNATVVVLGCQVNGETPSLMLSRRLEAAYTYLQREPTAACIVSGGKGNHEEISEAECMYRWLTNKGIAPERIFREDRSRSTAENLAFSAEIIHQNGLSQDLAIVTDGFHQLRASYLAQQQGMSSGAVSANTPFYLLGTFSTRELLALTAAFLLP